MSFYPFLASIFIMLASLSGVFFIWQGAGAWVEKNLRYLTSFATGVFLVTALSLTFESLHLGESLIILVLGMIAGGLFLELAVNLIPGIHHHHGVEEKDDCGDGPHSHIDARRMMIGDSIHNISDGILLVSAFLIDTWFGVVTAFAIFLHELVQEIAEFFVLREAGFSSWGALWRNFLISTTILIGLLIGYFVADANQLVGPLLAFAAGGFFYIIFRDLLPSVIKTTKSKKVAGLHVLAIVLGLGVMLGVTLLASHSHESGEDIHHDEEEHVDLY